MFMNTQFVSTYLGISEVSMQEKIRCKKDWTKPEIGRIARLSMWKCHFALFLFFQGVFAKDAASFYRSLSFLTGLNHAACVILRMYISVTCIHIQYCVSIAVLIFDHYIRSYDSLILDSIN